MMSLPLSFGQKVVLALALPTTAVLVYLLWKNSDEDDADDTDEIVTSRQTVIEVKVPRSAVGAIIGRQGCMIKEIMQKTGAKLRFKDHANASGQDDGPDRCIVIRGTTESAQDAENMIHRIIAEQPEKVTIEISVPQKSLGIIIGRGGESVREITRISKARVNIPHSTGDRSRDGMVAIALAGTCDQVQEAKNLIEEKVEEFEVKNARTAVVTANRKERGRPKEGKGSFVSQPKQISMPDHKDFLEVYVSALESPSQFWVQILTASSAKLDKLVENMTALYDEPESAKFSRVASFNKDDIVAAPFEYDDSWYRARIVAVEDDTVSLFYVDYGDSGRITKEQVRTLRSDFLSVPFQAVECCLAGVVPVDDKWSDEATDHFEDLTLPGKWKVVLARTKRYKETADSAIPCIELIDTNGPQDVDVAKSLVDKGFCKFDGSPVQCHVSGRQLAASEDTEAVVDDDDSTNDEVVSEAVDMNNVER